MRVGTNSLVLGRDDRMVSRQKSAPSKAEKRGKQRRGQKKDRNNIATSRRPAPRVVLYRRLGLLRGLKLVQRKRGGIIPRSTPQALWPRGQDGAWEGPGRLELLVRKEIGKKYSLFRLPGRASPSTAAG